MGIRGLSELARTYIEYVPVSQGKKRIVEVCSRFFVTVDGGFLINSSLQKVFSPNDERNLNIREIIAKLLVLRRMFPLIIVVFDGSQVHPIKERYSRMKAFQGLTPEQKQVYIQRFTQENSITSRSLEEYLEELALLHDQERSHIRRFNRTIMTFVFQLLDRLGIFYYIAKTEADFVMAKMTSQAITVSGDSDMIFLCDYVITKIIPPTKNKHIHLLDDYDQEGGVFFLNKCKMILSLLREKKITNKQHFHTACFLSNTEINVVWKCTCKKRKLSSPDTNNISCCNACRPDFQNILSLLTYHTATDIWTKRCWFPQRITPSSLEEDIRTYYNPHNHPETLQLNTIPIQKTTSEKKISAVHTENEKKYLTSHGYDWILSEEEEQHVIQELCLSHEKQIFLFGLLQLQEATGSSLLTLV